jgi:hypothetical protein
MSEKVASSLRDVYHEIASCRSSTIHIPPYFIRTACGLSTKYHLLFKGNLDEVKMWARPCKRCFREEVSDEEV